MQIFSVQFVFLHQEIPSANFDRKLKKEIKISLQAGKNSVKSADCKLFKTELQISKFEKIEQEKIAFLKHDFVRFVYNGRSYSNLTQFSYETPEKFLSAS